MDLYHSLRTPYRRNAVFIMNDATVKALRKLKNGSGDYIWQPSVTANTPDTILNRPVVTSGFMPTLATGNKTILFGDMGYYAGITGLPSGFRTGNMPSNLEKTGAFTELVGDKYQSQSAYLGRGDILVTKTNGHTVVVLTNGSKYEGTIRPVEYALGDRIIVYGCAGEDVKLMQEMLLKLGVRLWHLGL